MFFSWYGFAMLALESGNVIGLRCQKVLQGGASSLQEMQLMCAEKQLACSEACTALARGASANGIVELYRSKVAANQSRLGGSPS